MPQDVYMLAQLVYELVTRRRWHAWHDEATLKAPWREKWDVAARVKAAWPTGMTTLRDEVGRGLAIDPEQRPRSVAALLEAIESSG